MNSRSLRSAITVVVVVAAAFAPKGAAAASGTISSGASATAAATRMSLTGGPMFAGCPVLPADSAFNTPIEMMLFIAILLVGYLYLLKKKALEWD